MSTTAPTLAAALALMLAPVAVAMAQTTPASPAPAGTTATPGAAATQAQPAWYAELYAPDLIGKPVRNAAGDELGEIGEVAKTSGTGDLVAVVESGGLLGFFAHENVVPLGEMKQENGAFVLPEGSQNKLRARPDFDEGTYPPVSHFTQLGAATQ